MALTTVNSGGIKDDSIVNADIKSDAAIAGSKLDDDSIAEVKLDISNTASDGQFLQYKDSTDKLTWATVSTTDATKMPLAGGTFTGDVVFDNAANAGRDLSWNDGEDKLKFENDTKAVFGSDNDLTIQHTSDHSRITHGGAGNLIVEVTTTDSDLYLRAEDKVHIQPHNGNDGVVCNAQGSTDLFYNNSKKLETTDTGASVTGALNAAGATFGDYEVSTDRTSGSNKGFVVKRAGTMVGRLCNHGSGPEGKLELYNSATQNLNLNGTNGDMALNGYIRFGISNGSEAQLDDYEEGTYTAVVSGTDGEDAVTSSEDANYVKIGHICVVSIQYSTTDMDDIDSSAVLRVNLPFTSKASGNNVGQMACSEWSIGSQSIGWMAAKVNNNESHARFQYHNGANNNTNDLTRSASNGSLNFRGTVTYITA